MVDRRMGLLGCSTKTATTEVKDTTLAALASWILPGAGQYYCGKPKRGAMFLIGTIIGLFIMTVPGIILWIVNIADAYSLAKKINTGAATQDTNNPIVNNPIVNKIGNMSNKKKILIVAGILFILVIVSGAGQPRTIEVSGSPDVDFSGTYGTLNSMATVRGNIYDNKDIHIYDVPSTGIVSAVFQKESAGQYRSGGGILTVKIKRGSRVIQEATTTARYGVVTVTD